MSSRYKSLKRSTRLILDEVLDAVRDELHSDTDSTLRPVECTPLEQRLLMSASPLVAVADAPDAQVDVVTADSVEALDSGKPGQYDRNANDAGTTGSAVTNGAADSADAGRAEATSESIIAAADSEVIRTTVELVVIDPAADDWEQLVADIRAQTDRNFEVLLLDPHRDGIGQITDRLQELQDVSAVHLVSHGDEGEILLGTSVLSQRSIERYAAELVTWQHSMTADADLLIYGCDLAASDRGVELTESLNVLLGTDVAASDDDTGHARYSADWDLEYSLGEIQATVAFTADLQATWEGKLATITVDTFLDVVDGGDGVISLREAIDMATAGDTIQLSAGTYNLSLTGTEDDLNAFGDLDISNDVNIVGAGSGAGGTTIDGNGVDRVFHVLSGNVTISHLKITGGDGTTNSPEDGGGILLEATGDLTLSNVLITGNHARNGGGIKSAGTLQLTDVTIDGNTSTQNGAGLGSTGDTTLNRVTVSNNIASGSLGGGIEVSQGTFLATNVTLSGNTAGTSGGGIAASRAITFQNVTITDNTAGTGAGVHAQGAGSVDVRNSIIAGNNTSPDVNGTFVSSGNNLIGNVGTASGFTDGVNGDQVGSGILNLGGLQDNGGSTFTHALLAGSTAIDAGAAAGAPLLDQRGFVRDAFADVGAYEFNAPASALPDTSEFRVNTTSIDVQETRGEDRGSQQAVSVAADGTHVVAWSSMNQDGSGWGVYARRFDITGTALTGEITVAQTTADNQQWARVATDAVGNFVVTWTGTNQDGTPQSVYARRFDAAGAALANEFRVNTTASGTQKDSSIAMDSAGNFLIAWQGEGPGDTDGIFYRRFNADESAIDATDVLANGTNIGAQTDPDVALNDAGQFAISWASNTNVYVRHFDASGVPAHADVQVDSTSSFSYAPAIDIDASGRTIVVYRTDGFLGSGAGVWGRGFEHDGTERVAWFEPSDQSFTSNNTSPSIAMDDAGDFIVTYHGVDDGDGSGDSVKVRRYTADGTPLGPASQVNVSVTGDQNQASVALLNIDNFVVVWTGEGDQPGHVDDAGVFARQFHVEAPVLDLDADDSSGATGGDFSANYNDGAGPVAVVDADAVLTDANDTDLQSLIVAITDRQDGFFEVLAADATGTSISVSFNAFSGTLTLSGTDTVANYQQVLRTITYDNGQNPATGVTRTITFVANDGLIDSNVGTTSLSINVVANASPTAAAGGPYLINEGDAVNLDASASSDPDTDPLTYKWDLDNDGNFGEVGEPATETPTVSWATLQSFGIDDDGVYTIGVEVDDGKGGIDTATTTLTVNNIAPTLTTTGTGNAVEGVDYTLNLSAADPGNDTISSWTINWGDGTIQTVAGNPSSVTHTYTTSQAGFTFNILASATDEDGTHFQNKLLVASGGNDSVIRYTEDGTFEQQFAIGEGTDYPVDVIIGPDGNMYLSGWNSDDVLRYNPTTGVLIDTFVPSGTGGLNAAAGLAFGSDGNLYVASRLTSEVLRFNGTTGAFIDAFVTAGSGGLNEAEGLTFGPDGHLYVSDYRDNKVLKYDGKTGAYLTEFVSGGGLNWAEDLTFGPDGHLYVADNNSVIRYDGTTGAKIDAFATGGGVSFASGLAFGPDGNLYVGSWGTDNVLRYDGTTGAFIDAYISAGSGGLDNTDYLNFIPEHQVRVSSSIQISQTGSAVAVDGTVDAVWAGATAKSIDRLTEGSVDNAADLSGTWKALWDATHLYVMIDASDDVLINDSGKDEWQDDVVELFLDPNYSQDATYQVSDYQLLFRIADNTIATGANSATDTTGIQFSATTSGTGYIAEIAVPWTLLGVTPSAGTDIGIDLMLGDDDDGGVRDSQLAWNDTTANAWQNPSLFGMGMLTSFVNLPPVADAGGPYSINEGSSLALNGTASSDPNGDSLTYAWDLDNDGNYGEAGEPTTATPTVNWATLQTFGVSDDGVYTIGLQVDDGNGGASSSTSTITVNNVNPSGGADGGAGFTTDEATAFTSGSVLSNDTDPNSADVLSVTAMDVTGTVGSVINNGDGTFDYDPNGQFESLAFGQQTTDSFSYTVSDDDGGSSVAVVTITINGQNDAPTDISLSNSSVAENADGAVVGTLTTTDPDAGDTHTYTVDDTRFEVVGGQLKLKSGQVLDFEAEASVSVSVTSTDAQSAPVNRVFLLSVTDVNDHAPVIVGSQSFNVSELAANGTAVGTIAATDNDAGTTFSNWTITAGNSDGIFAVNAGTGQITVFDNTNLDFATTSSYVLSVTVSDGSNTSSVETVAINVTTGPLAPQVTSESYVLIEGGTVSETAIPGWFNPSWKSRQQITFDNSASTTNLTNHAVRLQLHASDADSVNVDYTKIQDSGQDLRFVDGNGVLLNHEIEQWDESGFSYVWVEVPQIDAGSNFDFVWMYYDHASVSDGQSSLNTWEADDVAVLHLDGFATDSSQYGNDGGQSGVTVATGITGGAGAWNGFNSYITLGSDASLDDIFNGGGTVSAWINADSYGENGYGRIADKASTTFGGAGNGDGWAFQVATGGRLIFEHGFSGGMGEWRTPTSSLSLGGWHHVAVVYDSSSDANDPLIYIDGVLQATSEGRTPSGIARSDAAIDLIVGNHSQVTSRTFDGRIDEFRISNSSTAADEIAAGVAATTGTFVNGGTVQSGPGGLLQNDTDANGDSLTVTLVSGPAHASSFSLNTDGSFSYTHDGTENFNDSFVYQVSDGTSVASGTVSLNITPVNENSPIIPPGQSLSVSEAAVNGTSLGTVAATDGDVGTTFSNWTITAGNADGIFGVDTTTGRITVVNNTNLDFETSQVYTLTLTVSDGANTSSAETVTISVLDQNDELPVVGSGQSMSVSDAAGIGTVVGTVTAADADAGSILSNWQITGGNSDGIFGISSSTGQIQVIDDTDLDYATQNQYLLTVTVSDGANTSSPEVVTVNIIDSNPNAPVIDPGQSLVVAESAANGTVVGTVTATDSDAGTVLGDWAITGGNSDGIFAIDVSSGQLTIADNTNLDFETRAVYNLQLRVSDGRNTSVPETISIVVGDINEAPWIAAISDHVVAEDSSSGPIIFRVGDPESTASTLSVTAVSSDQSLVANADIVLGGGGVSRFVRIQPVENAFGGPTTITVTVSDGVLTATSAFNVIISPVNDAPTIIGADPLTYILSSSSISVSAPGLLNGVTDVDGDALSVVVVSGPENGSLTVGPHGAFLYTADSEFSGTDTFVYRVTDGSALSSERAVVMQVPVAVAATGPLPPASSSASTSSKESDDSPPSAESVSPVVSGGAAVAENQPGERVDGRKENDDEIAPPFSPIREDEASTFQFSVNTVGTTQDFNFELQTAISIAATDRVNASELKSLDRQAETSAADSALPENTEWVPGQHSVFGYERYAELKGTVEQITEFEEEMEARFSLSDITAQSIAFASTSIVIGTVVSAIRGGMLALGLLSQLPVWTLFDPLMVTDGVSGEEGESLEEIVDRQAKKTETESQRNT